MPVLPAEIFCYIALHSDLYTIKCLMLSSSSLHILLQNIWNNSLTREISLFITRTLNISKCNYILLVNLPVDIHIGDAISTITRSSSSYNITNSLDEIFTIGSKFYPDSYTRRINILDEINGHGALYLSFEYLYEELCISRAKYVWYARMQNGGIIRCECRADKAMKSIIGSIWQCDIGIRHIYAAIDMSLII